MQRARWKEQWPLAEGRTSTQPAQGKATRRELDNTYPSVLRFFCLITRELSTLVQFIQDASPRQRARLRRLERESRGNSSKFCTSVYFCTPLTGNLPLCSKEATGLFQFQKALNCFQLQETPPTHSPGKYCLTTIHILLCFLVD